MAARQSVDRHTFLANLRQSGLVSHEQLGRLEDQLPETNRGRLVARALVRQGILTKFQAERLLAGRTNGFILGQYRILDHLGQGGMGRVFKAVHQTLNRVVALKVLAPQFIETEKAQRLFLREMRAVAQLHHPNLVAAYDANQIGNRHYLVMEHVDGPNLCQLVKEQGPLPPGLACELMRQAAEGLQYAHEMGMVHRDIKPSNLLVLLPGSPSWRKQYTLKILDFGLARFQTRDDQNTNTGGSIVTDANVLMGTPDFVSPEQARNLHAADIRSDLYSLGCTFYYVLTGRAPFQGGSALEKLVRHTTEVPVPVNRLRADVPEEVAAIVSRLMAKKPGQRFQTPGELAQALKPFAGEGRMAWTIAQTPPEEDALATASAELEDSFIADNTPRPSGIRGSTEFSTREYLAANDDLAALMSTMPLDLSATPLSGPRLSQFPHFSGSATQERQRIGLAIVTAIGIVGALIGLLTLLTLS
jgi:serine/threonine protein kinase